MPTFGTTQNDLYEQLVAVSTSFASLSPDSSLVACSYKSKGSATGKKSLNVHKT